MQTTHTYTIVNWKPRRKWWNRVCQTMIESTQCLPQKPYFELLIVVSHVRVVLLYSKNVQDIVVMYLWFFVLLAIYQKYIFILYLYWWLCCLVVGVFKLGQESHTLCYTLCYETSTPGIQNIISHYPIFQSMLFKCNFHNCNPWLCAVSQRLPKSLPTTSNEIAIFIYCKIRFQ